MQKYWKTQEFETASEVWEEKLRASGFRDAEKTVDGDRVLKRHSGSEQVYSGMEHRIMPEFRTSREEYFLLVSQHLEKEIEFEDELDRLIMERTAEGCSIKQISDELKNRLGHGKQRGKHNRNTIRYVRRRYENKWGIRIWQREQMVSRKAPTR